MYILKGTLLPRSRHISVRHTISESPKWLYMELVISRTSNSPNWTEPFEAAQVANSRAERNRSDTFKMLKTDC